MTQEVFDFDKQLSIGNRGEDDFCKYYPQLHPVKSKDRAFDFNTDHGTIEVKSDSYDLNNTPNFFMEIFGNISDAKMGGPWRSFQDGVDFFVYYFPKNKTFFWFEPPSLCRKLDTLVAGQGLNPKEIQNKGWVTRGYAVPREWLMDVLYKKDIF